KEALYICNHIGGACIGLDGNVKATRRRRGITDRYRQSIGDVLTRDVVNGARKRDSASKRPDTQIARAAGRDRDEIDNDRRRRSKRNPAGAVGTTLRGDRTA